MEKTKILFITWDGAQTNYLEGLTMPLFAKIMELNPSYEFHCIQFTWNNNLDLVKQYGEKYNIPYKSYRIYRKPFKSILSFYSLLGGAKHLKNYVKENNIDILMPRSNFPAFMTLRSKLKLPIIFDADGIPIEERLDFSSLSKFSPLYLFLRYIEKSILNKAEVVLTRSSKAITYHLNNYGIENRNKFYIVKNGRDQNLFKISKSNLQIKEKLNISPDSKIFIYVGSYGPQYCTSEMFDIFTSYKKINPNSHFIFLTGSPTKVKKIVPQEIVNSFTVTRVPYDEVPNYLNVADIAFALRKPTLSMQGVSPIKLGEYLLMGIPTIASKGIGDSETFLSKIPYTYLYDHSNDDSKKNCINFIKSLKSVDKSAIRMSALSYFSLEAAAKTFLTPLDQVVTNQKKN